MQKPTIASMSTEQKKSLPLTPYIHVESSDESDLEPEDDWYDDFVWTDDTILAGHMSGGEIGASPVTRLSEEAKKAQETQREYVETFKRVSDVLMSDDTVPKEEP